MRLYEGYADYEDYIHILRLFSQTDSSEEKVEFVFRYKTHGAQLSQLSNKFDYSCHMIEGKQFRSKVNLMAWVFDNLIGDGMCTPPSVFNAEYILRRTKTHKLRSNCYMYAVVLNEIFLSMGIKSRMVRCMPMDLHYQDCHCVTEAYCEEYKKWIVFDAANKAYYVDDRMEPLNLYEIRSNIMQKDPLYVPMMKRSLTAGLVKYLAKNLVRFESYQVSQYGAENLTGNITMFHFQSLNFPVRDKIVRYPERNLSIHHLHTSNPDLFWAEPQ